MDWLDIATRIVLPAFTFVLGIAATLWIKRAETRRTNEREHVQAIARLANQWYNQIHEIVTRRRTNPRGRESQQSEIFYIENRLILPDFLLHLEALRKINSKSDLIPELQKFLGLVTFEGTGSAQESENLSYRHCVTICRPISPGASEVDQRAANTWVGDLDRSLQEIVRIAGRQLAH